MKGNLLKKAAAILVLLLTALSVLSGCTSGNEENGGAGEESRIDENVEENDTQIEGNTRVITDSIGREIEIPYPVTSAAVANAYNVEIINAIDAIDSVVGVDYNIFQDKEGFKNRFTEDMVIGKSQKELNYEKIIEINPQVLILTGNGVYEEAEKQLESFGIKVVVVDAYYTDQFEQNCELLGKIFGKESEAEELSDYFMDKLDYINKQLEGVEKKTVYFEYRTEGNTTVPGDFFFNMVEFSGADNIFKTAENVQVDTEAVVVEDPQYIVKVSAPDVYSSYYPPTLEEHKAILDELASRPGWDEISAIKDNSLVEYENALDNGFPEVTENNRVLLLSHYVHGGASKLVGTMYIAKFLYPELLPELHPEQVFYDWITKYQKLDYIEGHTYPAYTFED
ncbi:ABC transporter substrate-binding protein [Anaerotignum faecicola]|nr:ABC transporter substrate-binding protein [Anaerotignum faecicola]